LCIKACPVDCIIGAPKQMHVIIGSQCTGCELCVPACPVDCIGLVPASGTRTGWDAWSAAHADESRARYAALRERLAREADENAQRLAAKAEGKLADLEAASRITDPAELARKRAMIEAVLAKSRARRGPPA
jgi:electron transport complex protein RnfB